MNTLRAFWIARVRSAHHALRDDERMRAVALILFLFDLAVGFASVNQLTAQLIVWRSQGATVLASQLWLLDFGIWSGMAIFAVLATLQSLGESNSHLITLPIPSSTLFRALYLSMIAEGLANWLLLVAGTMGVSLFMALGTDGWIWLALSLLGLGVTIWISMIATLLVIRYVVPDVKRLLLVALLGILLFIGIAENRPLSPSLPVITSALFLGLLMLAIGPLAKWTGELYSAAFRAMEGRDRSRAGLRIPGVALVTQFWKGRRSLTGALFTKTLLSQSRHLLAWGRILVVGVGLVLVPQVYAALLPSGFSPRFLVIAFASALSLASILEYAPYAISGEGNRLTLYLTAPFEIGHFLRARLVTFLAPVLIEGAVFGAHLNRWSGLATLEGILVVTTIMLILIGVTTLYVWGSVWDEDLNLAVEGAMQALLMEEIPSSARRMWLLSLGVVLFAAMLFLVWNLPAAIGMVLLGALDGVILVSTWHLSRAYLRELQRRG